jgi:hypothetical protein
VGTRTKKPDDKPDLIEDLKAAHEVARDNPRPLHPTARPLPWVIRRGTSSGSPSSALTIHCKDGRDGRSPEVRGLFSDKETYKALDIVALNGGSFIAKRDDPGSCPGDGWQLIASHGKRGDRGERGLPGIPGVPVVIQKWRLDRDNYIAIPIMSDGREGPPLELRSLFEQFHTEAR